MAADKIDPSEKPSAPLTPVRRTRLQLRPDVGFVAVGGGRTLDDAMDAAGALVGRGPVGATAARLAKLLNEGRTYRECGEALGVYHGTIATWARQMGDQIANEQASRAEPIPIPIVIADAEERARLRRAAMMKRLEALLLGGLTQRECAERLRVTEKTISKCIKASDALQAARHAGSQKRRAPALGELEQLLRRGLTQTRCAKILGASATSIRGWIDNDPILQSARAEGLAQRSERRGLAGLKRPD
ncbi:hypothetical protein LA345_13040 [Burkholderia vietnamiensis]|uniref:Uncharacterized protein n=1 Tax=Burkholderia vietnamiensis (strain G4 / LMG 22486) TaxID=269482 RepID=A4JFM4_BURVG|nr:hypothetical protein Bcep1808_2075 [Burkholderia vietnamiensis G4]MCB4344838.1 hypothetical protein [Burkholderia vietnamiensis]